MNTRHRKPSADKGHVAMPAYLKRDKVAVAYWNQHAPDLMEAKRLQPLQAEMFATICEMASDVRRLTDAVRKEGDVIDGQRGPMANPKVRLLRDARRDLLAAARGFGLDAASDARLPVEPPQENLEDDPLWEYIKPR